MKNKFKLTILLAAIAGQVSAQTVKKAKPATAGLTQYVDQLIGTGFHGHVFVGANVPFGAVQLGPTQLSQGWDWCSGYHISDSTIVGFQHTHLSGTGIGDLGDISFMPTTGKVIVNKGTLKDPAAGYYSLFSYKDEVMRPGYYAVKLKKYNIGVQLTASNRVGFHQYNFPKASNANVIIDLVEGIADRPTETYIKKINATTIEGYRFSKGWAAAQRIYFTAVFSKPISKFAVYDSTALQNGIVLKGKKVKGVLSFSTTEGEKVFVKVGISPVSSANALLNINTEVPGWDFNKVAAAAAAQWNKELGRITVKTDSLSQLKKFYTAMYHTMIAPSTFSDVNGEYWGTDKKVHRATDFKNFTTFSLWDTYRSANPLYTIMAPERVPDMINTMLNIYKQQGRLPVWHLMANETNTMVGNSAVPIVVDAVLKGFKGIDENLAYEAVKTTQMQDLRGLKYVKSLGYIPADSTRENVAMGLEYSINDFCIAQLAKKLGKADDYQYFLKRSKNYQNYFDKETRFMRGRVSATKWRTPFNPFESRHEQDDFTEGNAWQYTWLVPHDVEGLVTLLGGEKPFIQKLDSLFKAEGDLGKEHSPDISGLIGQYAHGNEPSHHIAYLYTYVGQPWKTADKVRFILDNFYTTKADGIIGNEDVGQMSAWYVLSSIGIYPVNPVNGMYVFGSPVVNEATINLPAGKKFHVVVKNNSSKNKYIQTVTLNGKPYSVNYLAHKDIAAGGELVITMGGQPTTFGTTVASRPHSIN
ncbi:glycoside hydrolase family 92 protein [Mucilaginibacter pallidiroseus]|uniref:Glycoside hydrolase family 92 protein n=1 Tax=Mucilaginibacter pallidiroseus TaxID=2599295 RepID=A0A563UIN7_9SPHI|nr:GH92 family glycosyl hydrolase [Mucilaginibacter pallidiroseus]TWR31128.1 glycoside hydrolase family 92 protein [Mucilaginibacter pallidiroseus]